MSDRLTFVTAPEVAYIRDETKGLSLVHADRVVGMLTPGSKSLCEYGRRITGAEREQQLGFDSDVDARIADFYEQHFTVPPEIAPFYNCHAFAFHAMGKIAALVCRDNISLSDAPVAIDALQPGIHYGVVAGGKMVHSTLGINDPNRNLGVIGDRSPLLITDNREIINAYGDYLIQYHPDSADLHV